MSISTNPNMTIDTAIYDQLFEKVRPFYISGRPGDNLHIESLYKKLIMDYAKKTYTYNPRIMLPAAILHDVGFGFVKEENLHFFAGQTKVAAMRDAIQALTLAYTPVIMTEFNFAPQEIEQVQFVITHADDEIIDIENPPTELILLHDLNLYDRFLPHRLETARKIYPDEAKVQSVLEKSLINIITPQIKKEASGLFNRLLK